MEAEERKSAILASIAREEIQKPQITKEHIEFFLYDMKNKIYNSTERIEIIIQTFVNAVYLYDDKMVITFNFTEGEELKKLELEDVEKFGFDTPRFTKKSPFARTGIFLITSSLFAFSPK